MTKKRIQNGVVHKVPMDLRNALTSHSDVLAEWNNLTPLARNEWICWTTSIKKQETRLNHIKRVCLELKPIQSAFLHSDTQTSPVLRDLVFQ